MGISHCLCLEDFPWLVNARGTKHIKAYIEYSGIRHAVITSSVLCIVCLGWKMTKLYCLQIIKFLQLYLQIFSLKNY